MEKEIQIYTLKNEDLTLSLKFISKTIEKAQSQISTKKFTIAGVNKYGNPKRIPNTQLEEVKDTLKDIEEIKKIREEIKQKYQQSKIKTVLQDLASLKRDLNDPQFRKYISSVSGNQERTTLKSLIDFDKKVKNPKKDESQNILTI